MSGLEVIGCTFAVIGIIDTSIKIYNGAWKDLKLSGTFETVRSQLPIILNSLQTRKNHLEPIQGSMPANVCEALEETFDTCKGKGRKLREIFEEVIPGENDGWEKRYLTVFKRLGKGNKVEELIIAITESVQLISKSRFPEAACSQEYVSRSPTVPGN